MKKSMFGKWVGAAALATIGMFNVQATAASVNVDIYSGFADVGGGAPFSGLVGSFTSPTVDFASATGYNWHPFGQGSFGARVTGCILFDSHNGQGIDTFTLGLDSDDGSLLFIDNVLAVDNGGPHYPGAAFGNVTLPFGVHSFEIQFFEDFGGPSGLDLILPTDARLVDCHPVPEAGTLAAAGVLAGLVATGVRRRAASR